MTFGKETNGYDDRRNRAIKETELFVAMEKIDVPVLQRQITQGIPFALSRFP